MTVFQIQPLRAETNPLFSEPIQIQLTQPIFVVLLVLLFLILIYCCYLIYFAFTTGIKKIKHTYFPTVSVMVDAKNAGNTIERRIENLLKQNYPKNKYEIIVYDRNSKDETRKICERYAQKGLIKYIRGTSEIKGPLLDLAIKKLAKGEVLLLTDPDVISEKNWIVDIVQPFSDANVGSVAGTVHCGNYYRGFLPLMRAVEDEWRFVVPMLRNSETVFPVGANQAIRRKAWEQTKFGKAILDDLDITTRIIDKGWKAVGVSASGVEEEVETLGQYWRQRTRWYKVNVVEFLGTSKRWKKFLEGLPQIVQPVSLVLMALFFISLLLGYFYLAWLILIEFTLLTLAMSIAFIRTRTGKAFIPAIPLFLTFDALLFGITFLYVQTIGRFIHLTKETWPTLQGNYYHVGSELRTWFFKFEEKVRDYTRI